MDSNSISLRKVGDGLPSAVLLPGWATDYRVFDSLDLPANRLIPLDPFLRGLDSELASYICANDLAPVALVGWSLGGFTAVDFANHFPELVSNLILCGIRLRYSDEQIEATRQAILDDRVHFLTSFYRQCFLPAQREDYQRFREQLMPCYLKDMSADRLIASLNYLRQVEIDTECLPQCSISIIHGAHDIVAPVEEAIAIAKADSNVQLHIIQNAGHAAFLTAESKAIIHRCLKRL